MYYQIRNNKFQQQDETAVESTQRRKHGLFRPAFRPFLLSSLIAMLTFSRMVVRWRCVPREKKGGMGTAKSMAGRDTKAGMGDTGRPCNLGMSTKHCP